MNIRLKGAALGLALVLSAPAFADDVPAPAAAPEAKVAAPVWVADFDQAVAAAKAAKKDLLVDFTGSGWCGWCTRLHEEVFSHDEFLAAAQKDYVLVALDFDEKGNPKSDSPNAARSDELKTKHHIAGFPTVLLMTADGDVFGKTGYQPGGPAKYVEHIAKLRADGMPALASAKAIVAEIASAKDGDKAAAQAKAIAALAALEPGAATAGILAEPVKAAFEGDPENKAGVRAKAAAALLKSGSADEAVVDAAAALDPKNELGLLELTIVSKLGRMRSLDDVAAAVKSIDDLVAATGPKDKKVAKELFIAAMSLCQRHLKDPAKAKVYAAKIREAGYGEGEEKLKEFVDKLLAEEAPKDAK